MDTLQQLLTEGVVPIVNENDTVSTDEIKFEDNDTPAALVACITEADLLLFCRISPGLLTWMATVKSFITSRKLRPKYWQWPEQQTLPRRVAWSVN